MRTPQRFSIAVSVLSYPAYDKAISKPIEMRLDDHRFKEAKDFTKLNLNHKSESHSH